MAIVAHAYRYVVGVDTHARSHTLALVDTSTGQHLDTQEFSASPAGLERACAWIGRHTGNQPTLVGVEGTSSYGALLAAALAGAGFEVCEVKPPRKAARGSQGKTDSIDALAGAVSLLGAETGRLVRPRGGQPHLDLLQELLSERDMLTTSRTARINHLTAYCRTTAIGIDARNAMPASTINTIAAWDGDPDPARRIAARQAQAILAINGELETNMRDLRGIVRQTAPALLAETGVGPVVAARLIVCYGTPGRVRSEAAFAALAGVNPVPASSGNTVRYRLNRWGDRKLNNAIHTVTLTRERLDPATRAYIAKRTLEGKTRREIRRCLKRIICRQLYRKLHTLMTSHTAEPQEPTLAA
jgi:transposase